MHNSHDCWALRHGLEQCIAFVELTFLVSCWELLSSRNFLLVVVFLVDRSIPVSECIPHSIVCFAHIMLCTVCYIFIRL